MEIKRGILDLPQSEIRQQTRPGIMMSEQFWFAEDGAANVVIPSAPSIGSTPGGPVARIDVVDTVEYGRMLFLTGSPVRGPR